MLFILKSQKNFTANKFPLFSIFMTIDDSEVAPMYIGKNDENMKGIIKFRNVETIMLLYPTIVWLQLMKKSTTYVKSELLSKFHFQRGIVNLKGPGRKPSPCKEIPTWNEIVGSDAELADGIMQYLVKDKTPNSRYFCSVKSKNNATEVAVPALVGKKASITKVINRLVVDLQTVHSTSPADSPWYTYDKRVLVDHLLQVIRSCCIQFSNRKANNLHKLDLLWKVSMYFRVIFDLMAYFSHQKYMDIVSQDARVESILCKTEEPTGKMAFYTKSVSQLNQLFIESSDEALDHGFTQVFQQTPAERYKRIPNLSIVEGVVTQLCTKYVRRLVEEECSIRKNKNNHGLDFWYYDSADESRQKQRNNIRHVDPIFDITDAEDEANRQAILGARAARRAEHQERGQAGGNDSRLINFNDDDEDGGDDNSSVSSHTVE